MSNAANVVGERELSLSNGNIVTVSIGFPLFVFEGEYECSYRIVGLPKEEGGRVVGSDALQALQLALIRVGAILYTSEDWTSGALSWNGDRNLGFPLPESIRDLRDGASSP
jgi:hypothetical protein